MNTTIYIVSFNCYTAADNFLYGSREQTTLDPNEAIAIFNQLKGEAYDMAHNPDELDEEKVENGSCRIFEVHQEQQQQGTVARGYIASRAKGTQDEFQARVFITEHEIELPYTTDRRIYGMSLKEVRDKIADFAGDKKREAMRKAKIFAKHISLPCVIDFSLSYGHKTDEHGNRTEDHNWLVFNWQDKDGNKDTFSIIDKKTTGL